MDGLEHKPTQKRNPFTFVMGGCLAALYLALCVVIVIFGRQQIENRNAPTPTSTTTAVPQILINAPADQSTVTYEDFSANQNDWTLYFEYGKLEIINGKLILQSNVSNGLAIGTSQEISPTTENYYIQADFSTDIRAAEAYGLVFGLNRSLTTYYLFEIWPRTAGVQLFKHNAGIWTELIRFTPAHLSPYPQANTLSVSFDKGDIKLYINGKMVSEYSDKEFFQSKDVGVFVNNTGYRLFVDNLFVYGKK